MKINQLRKKIDIYISNQLPKPGATCQLKDLKNAYRYSTISGGKRLRPLLCLGTYLLFKSNLEQALPCAAAIELVHAFSLIHDDLPCMDNDDFRRGKPTCHKAFGQDVALLTGDYLLNHAYTIILRSDLLTDRKKVHVLSILASAIGHKGLIGGQVIDIQSAREKSPSRLLAMYARKTGALFHASVTIGLILGNASKKEQHILDTFGKKYGLAFQLIDDLLDLEQDKKNNIKSYPQLTGIEKTKNKIETLLKEIAQLVDKISSKNKAIILELTSLLQQRHP